jgi:hypothetical protein
MLFYPAIRILSPIPCLYRSQNFHRRCLLRPSLHRTPPAPGLCSTDAARLPSLHHSLPTQPSSPCVPRPAGAPSPPCSSWMFAVATYFLNFNFLFGSMCITLISCSVVIQLPIYKEEVRNILPFLSLLFMISFFVVCLYRSDVKTKI